MFRRIIVIVLVASVPVLFFLGFRAGKQNQPPSDELQRALAQVALKSLRAQYDLLESGSIPQLPFIPLHDGETHVYRSGEQRIEAALRVRGDVLASGKTYKLHELNLVPTGTEQDDETIILHAVEKSSYYLSADVTSGNPILTQEWPKHDFIFSVSSPEKCDGDAYAVQYAGKCFSMIEDVTEPQAFEPSDESTGCCDEDEKKYESKISASPLEGGPGKNAGSAAETLGGKAPKDHRHGSKRIN
ncbi:MAG: hypothetical protein DMF61_15005 [Blastocatellia bacterium AA13]|nr:MAG: hypothetical protein DMF61_15005 [Blastocatellia bacterium AA13]